MTGLHELLHAAVDEAAASATPVADWLTGVRAGIRRRRRRRAVAAASGLVVVSLLGVGLIPRLGARDSSVVAGVPDAVRAAESSVVRVTGVAPSCSRRVQGTGFYFAPGRVMTNAHVLAGVTEDVHVATADGRTAPATVVQFDPARDIAVLRVDGLDEPALGFAEDAAVDGDEVYGIGFPDDSDRRTRASRVLSRQNARGPDIYQADIVTRDIYELQGASRPGEPGSPLLATDGRLVGMLLARAVDSPDATYALAASELRAAAHDGATATESSSTRVCD